MDRALSDLKRISQLAARRDAAYQEWQALSRDPACWSDPEKRKAMLNARIAYQDALTEYVLVFRGSKSISRPHSSQD